MSPEIFTLLDKEMTMARTAISEKNDGKARVCARRAIVILMQHTDATEQSEWNSRLALEHLTKTDEFPNEVVNAAKRLQGGLRAQLLGEEYSENPIEDAEIIIRYFVDLP
ncbi:MAG: hypothetical protein HYZ54_14795 [Ignavibacteriae bacterium]|nr:hypothetical protein [Ignavibacteriota bacterium]